MEGGFGLVELLVVLVVLGVLAAIVLTRSSSPRGPASTGASVAACRADLSIIETAVQTYRSIHGGAPTSISDLTSGSPALLASWPTDPHFEFSMPSPGTVVVRAPIGSRAQPSTSLTACNGAGPRAPSTNSTSSSSRSAPPTTSL